MMDISFQLRYQYDTVTFFSSVATFTTDMIYPISITKGLKDYKPYAPFVANTGEMTFYIDNTSSDFRWSDASTNGLYSETGIGAYYMLTVHTAAVGSSDYLSSDYMQTLFQGRVAEWNAEPGLFEGRYVEVVTKDYIQDLAQFPADGLSVRFDLTPPELLALIDATIPYNTDLLPEYSTNDAAYPVAWFDIQNGITRTLTAVSKTVGSAFGHYYIEPEENNGFEQIRYISRDNWIDNGVDLATFDNQWLAIDISKGREYQFSPINVTYHPTSMADTDIVLFEFLELPTIRPGKTWRRFGNYRDPANKAKFVTLADTDLTTPVSGTDYVVTGVASSDLSVSLTNFGSAGKYIITNNGTENAVFTTLQIRGKPIYSYDAATITSASSDGNPATNVLNLDLPYISDGDFAESVFNFLDISYNRYPEKSIIKSITFQASADSDAFEIARTAKISDIVHIIEDVNGIDDDYRIIGWDWDIYGCNDIQVTFYVHPNEYMTLHMVDSDGDHMVDSDGDRFAFWR